ncbi:MAG: hypothetical protein K2N01_05615 [Lachnospiraceae bacterium]|nr:hypothetical protein [Lachnospiraceae bacterium]
MNGINTSYGKMDGYAGITEDTKGIQNAEGKQDKKDTDSDIIFAGNLKLGDDPVGETRAKAERDALKVIMDTFSGEHKVDEEVKQKAEHIKKLDGDIKEQQADIRELRNMQDELKAEYKVADDSEEAQDLELLKREARTQDPRLKEPMLTMDEKERLSAIHEKGLTEYQERVMGLYRNEVYDRGEVEDMRDEQRQDDAYRRGVREMRWKRHDMIDSQKVAEEILAAASSEIKGLLVNEAVDHMDEKLEEEVEKAEEKKDKETEKQPGTDDKTNQQSKNLKDVQSTILRGEANKRVAEHKMAKADILGLAYDKEV